MQCVITSLADVVRDVRQQIPIRMVTDLTESMTGMATPIWKVRVNGREAILRAVIDPNALEAYSSFTGSGITPDLLASGSVNGHRWAVIEWTPGQVLFDPSSRPMRVDLRLSGHLDDALDLSEQVLRVAADLPRVPAPQGCLEESRARIRERSRALSVGPAQATASRLEQTLDSNWGEPLLQHGDLNPMNTIFVERGHYRLIDLLGGYGPLERDAGWWSAMVLMVINGKDDMRPEKRAVAFTRRISERLDHLDYGLLCYWTASALMDRVAVGAVGLNPSLDMDLLRVAEALT